MKFYSDKLNKLFESADDCAKAEAAAIKAEEEKKAAEQKKAETRKARAKEVEDALKASVEARAKYDKLLREFCKDYGAFHYSFNSENEDENDIFNFFRLW